MSENTADAVRVAVRIRPLLEREKSSDEREVVRVDGPRVVVGADGSEGHSFTATPCFPPTASQRDVYRTCGVRGLLTGLINGLSGTLFAYGQTGSGKTYTIFGTSEPAEEGVFSRAIADLYSLLPSPGESSWSLLCSVCEVYMNEVYDLLAPPAQRKPLTIRQRSIKSREAESPSAARLLRPLPRGPGNGARAQTAKLKSRGRSDVASGEEEGEGFYVSGCRQEPCGSAEDVMRTVSEALKERRVGSHMLNDRSSRSHCLVTLQLSGEGPLLPHSTIPEGAAWKARLTLVDLAGSERLKETMSSGETQKEGQYINSSLFSLGQVITSLNKRARLIAQREAEGLERRKKKSAARTSGVSGCA